MMILYGIVCVVLGFLLHKWLWKIRSKELIQSIQKNADDMLANYVSIFNELMRCKKELEELKNNAKET